MSKKKQKATKDLTVIESLVERSKEIILCKEAISQLKKSLFFIARTRHTPLGIDSIRGDIESYKRYINEQEVACANLLKVTYGPQYNIEGNKFWLSSTDIQSGFCLLRKKATNDILVLFLSDNEDAFLEPIESGEIHPLNEVEDRLKYCKPLNVFSGVSYSFIEKYKETKD